MFHRLRALHRWLGLTAALALILIASTGFLLATKDTFGWVKPKTHEGEAFESLSEVVTLDAAAQAAIALGIPELKSKDDIERIDYRPEKNVFKIVTHKGYHEVQVDGKTGAVLNVAKRIDQMAEDIHDFRYFSDKLHLLGSPTVAILLFGLGVTGVTLFFVPVVRRWRYKRKKEAE
ncbi:MAG: PepSY domain-containing protein [Armatimonadota bacterium]|nr:PepSY domain-containing protein [Armatimonadota bacterium]